MKLFSLAVLSLALSSNAFASRQATINEVPEAIVKNLGNSCSAPALAQGVKILEVKNRNIDSVYAIPCYQEGRGVIGNLVYVYTTKGSYKYLNFERGRGTQMYVPTPSLELSNGEVLVRFSAQTPSCRKGESGSYKIIDNSGFLLFSFSAEKISHTCEN